MPWSPSTFRPQSPPLQERKGRIPCLSFVIWLCCTVEFVPCGLPAGCAAQTPGPGSSPPVPSPLLFISATRPHFPLQILADGPARGRAVLQRTALVPPDSAASRFFLTCLCSRCMPARFPRCISILASVPPLACHLGAAPAIFPSTPPCGPDFCGPFPRPRLLCANPNTQKPKTRSACDFSAWLPSELYARFAPALTPAAAPCLCVHHPLSFVPTHSIFASATPPTKPFSGGPPVLPAAPRRLQI